MSDRDLHRLNEMLAIAGSLLTIAFAVRMLLGPDATKQLQMRAYRSVSRNAKRGSEKLSNIAMAADTSYHRLTM